jgi:zinc transport system substrate-binding protein
MNKKQQTLIIGAILTTVIVMASATIVLSTPASASDVNIVVTFYPLAYFSQEIGGEYVHVTQLVPNNTEIHSWEPSTSHIAATEQADILVYNGAGLDHWFEEDILPVLSNETTRIVVETTHDLELLSGEEHEHEEEHDHGPVDPHTWVSPYMSRYQAQTIYEALIARDPDHESYYTDRWLALKTELEQLDNQYMTELSDIQKNLTIVSHEAFGYLAHRYGFEQHGVIGLSADEQPSASTLTTLLTLMEEHEVSTVYVDPIYSSEYALTLKNDLESQTGTTVHILQLYLMLGEVDDKDFMQQMQSNLDNLKIGLEATS